MPSNITKRDRGSRTKAGRRLISGVTGLLLAASALFVQAEPAHAAYYGNAWINIGSWNCYGGGKVMGVWGAVDGIWSGGDYGDNVLYVKARVGASNVFNARIYCDRPWYDPRGDYWSNVVWKTFTPAYNNQGFWF